MSSPITSVPDPADGASTSADPLAGVITQVSPRQATSPIRGGPARPMKVAKQGTAKAAKAERKSKSLTAPSNEEDTSKGSEAVAVVSSTEGTANLAQGETSAHSPDPSSTLVGTTTTQPSLLTTSESTEGLSKDKPVDASATPTEPDPTSADTKPTSGLKNQQDMTEAAKKLSKTLPSTATKAKRSSGADAMELSEKGSAGNTASPLSSTAKKGKRPSLMAKLIAILTCSSATGAMVEAERDAEKKSSSSNQVTKSANGKTTKNDNQKVSRSKVIPSSQRASMERTGSSATTPGGGTRLPKEETGDVMSGAVVPPGSSFVTQEGEHKRGAAPALGAATIGGVAVAGVAAHKVEEDEDEDGEEEDGWMGDDELQDEDQTEEQRLIMQGGAGIPKDENGNLQPLLGPIGTEDTGRKCLVLDLDETLVHSSFKMISNADFIVPVEIEGTVHNVYVIKRPGVDEFMRQMGEIYEVVVFTASLSKYADPVLDILDIHHVVRHRLFRESCYNHKGNYVKDLSQLGREIHTSIIIDNSPASYIFHPNNAVPISSWFNDPHDTELTDLCPFLAELADVDDVRAVLDGGL